MKSHMQVVPEFLSGVFCLPQMAWRLGRSLQLRLKAREPTSCGMLSPGFRSVWHRLGLPEREDSSIQEKMGSTGSQANDGR